MSTLEMRLFAFPDELIAMLAEQCDRLGLVATLYEPPLKRDCPGVTVDLRRAEIDWQRGAAGQRRIMLGPPSDQGAPCWGDLVPARLGWVDVSVGNLCSDPDRRILEMSSIGARSDFFEVGHVLEDRRSHRLLHQITRPLKRRLHRLMWVTNYVYGGERVYSIYYSDRAASFYDASGELRQDGVANQRFSPVRDDSRLGTRRAVPIGSTGTSEGALTKPVQDHRADRGHRCHAERTGSTSGGRRRR